MNSELGTRLSISAGANLIEELLDESVPRKDAAQQVVEAPTAV